MRAFVMARRTSVRYTTQDVAAADANQRLIDTVFAELRTCRSLPGLSYRVSRSPDGLSFEHVAVVESEPNPLLALASFRAFSSTIAERVLSTSRRPDRRSSGAVPLTRRRRQRAYAVWCRGW